MKKPFIIVVAVSLICLAAVGATIAWLTDSAEKTNSFTVGKIDIELSEPSWVDNSKIYPGAEIAKDPTVTVKANSEDCYVYVMIDNHLNDTVTGAVTLDVGADWTQVATLGSMVLYRYSSVVSLSDSDQQLAVFTKVSVDTANVTEGNIDDLDGKTIDVKAYAHQSNAAVLSDVDTAAKSHFGMS